MIKELKEFLENLRHLNVKDVAILSSAITVKRLEVGDILVKSGERNDCYFMVLKGMLRNYVELENGEERTMRLSYEGMSSGTTSAIDETLLATETIVALEDSLVACIDRPKLEKIGRERPNVMIVYAEQLKKAILEANEVVRFSTTMSPEDRYIYIRDNHPKLIQRVQLNYIASFIGITDISLYRIRARIAKSGK